MKTIFCATAIMAVLLFACLPPASKTPAAPTAQNNNKVMDTLTITHPQDDGGIFFATVGQPFKVVFPKSCIGCASAWAIDGIDTAKLKYERMESFSMACEGCVGGYSNKTMYFTAVGKGTSRLYFKVLSNTFAITMTVK